MASFPVAFRPPHPWPKAGHGGVAPSLFCFERDPHGLSHPFQRAKLVRTSAFEMEEAKMEFIDKARIRLDHWIHHSEDHYQEYVSFAKELEEAGKIESARHLKDMVSLSVRSTECLKEAMKALG
jgi:hypothetical protein